MTSRISPAAPSTEDDDAQHERTTATVVATVRFCEELNDFIARDRRRREFDFDGGTDATIKDVIEALGVPHTEVELILVNGVSVDFAQRLRQGERISVYPQFEAFGIIPLLRLRPYPLRVTRFVADAHRGGLARPLRTAGCDALHDHAFDAAQIERIAGCDGRIVLTRDRDLLKHSVKAATGATCANDWRRPSLRPVANRQNPPRGPGESEAFRAAEKRGARPAPNGAIAAHLGAPMVAIQRHEDRLLWTGTPLAADSPPWASLPLICSLYHGMELSR